MIEHIKQDDKKELFEICNGEAKLFGSHDYKCKDRTTGEVKAVMNVDAAVIPDNKTLEINIGINSLPSVH